MIVAVSKRPLARLRRRLYLARSAWAGDATAGGATAGGQATNLRDRYAGFAHRTPLLPIAVSLATGILLDHLLTSGGIGAAVAIAVLIAMVVTVWGRRWDVGGPVLRIFSGGALLPPLWLCVAVMAIGGVRHALDRHTYDAGRLSVAAAGGFVPAAGAPQPPFPTTVVGRVASHPIEHPRRSRLPQPGRSEVQTRMVVNVSGIRSGASMRPAATRLRVHVDAPVQSLVFGGHPLSIGDEIQLYGKVRLPDRPGNPGGFDAARFHRRRGTHGTMTVRRAGDVVMVRRASTLAAVRRPLSILSSLSDHGQRVLRDHCPGPTGDLAAGMVLGRREGISPALRRDMLATGTVHLLSVSGLHLAIVVAMVSAITNLMWLSRWQRLILVLTVAGFYIALTGGRPPVIRAGVLISMLWFSYVVGRPSSAFNALSLAAIGLLMFDPQNLFAVGVHLSFVAVVSLMCAGRRLLEIGAMAVDAAIEAQWRIDDLIDEQRSVWQRRLAMVRRYAWAVVYSSAAVTAVTLPLVWYHYHLVSVVAVAINIAMSPLLSVALGGGLATIAADALCSPLAVVPGWVTRVAATSILFLVERAAGFTGSHFWLPSPPGGSVIVFYAVLLSTMLLPPVRWARRVRVAWIVGWIAVTAIAVTRPVAVPPGVTEATFIDVGHGTSVLIRRGEKNYLYDCGSLGNDQFLSRDIETVLWDRRVTRLDGVILSHADADHFNALPALLRRFRVDRIYTPPGMLSEDEPAVAILSGAIHRHGVPVTEVHRGDRIEGRFGVLHPPADRIGGSDNANSMVIIVDNGSRPLILPGDLEPPGTSVVMSMDRPVAGGILMAPHHGSLRMRAGEVLSWCRPAEVVVSGSSRAAVPEVAAMLGQFGAGVHVTATRGAIRVRIQDDGGYDITPFR